MPPRAAVRWIGRRARFKTAGQATNQRSWGSQPPHMRLTMHSTSLGSVRAAPRAPRPFTAPGLRWSASPCRLTNGSPYEEARMNNAVGNYIR
jgi:hypothetical protein